MTKPSSIEILSWQAVAPGEPLQRTARRLELASLRPDEAVVEVAGCGVCHTDLGFLYDGTRPGKPFPLTLGHEISGRVVHAGASAASLVGTPVVVPAVIPCGECALCKQGRGSICRKQIFPGSDVDGGFATHVVVPARGLCPVDEAALGRVGLGLADVSVLADAISTAYQAVIRSGVRAGDLAAVVGVGGVGGFAAQIAAALGAHVVALDVDDERLRLAGEHGAALTINSRGLDPGEIRKRMAAEGKQRGWPALCWKLFETSGRTAGQQLAFGLLGFGATMMVVGFTRDKVDVRLSNLMAFDATLQGNWGCLPEHYPAALQLVLDGKVRLAPFIERRPLSSINDTFRELHEGKLKKRPVLVPDFA